ncbi:hypothetical protein VTN77DRAFT_9764 [Rasamsonia byssochlamydoides]|uniref:uncharacterized protein n=1 Tax=Rasamsonia byssochlamydoides TaxID=89139 RepID=UPI003742C92E
MKRLRSPSQFASFTSLLNVEQVPISGKMAMSSNLLRRACTAGSNSPECQKPVNQTILNVVPAAILGGVILITGIVLFLLVRRKRKQEQLEDDKESIEIDVYEPPIAARPVYPEPAYQRQSDLSLSSATLPGRGPSASTTTLGGEELDKGPYGLATASDNNASKSAEDVSHVPKSERPLE